MTTRQKGNLTELQCLTAFCQLGYEVSIPYGNNAHYDFIADVEGYLLRVQVKTCRMWNEGEAIRIACKRVVRSHSRTKDVGYSSQEVDYICTSHDGQCYLIPIEECSTDKTLRLLPPKNGQTYKISMAEDYTMEAQLQKFIKPAD